MHFELMNFRETLGSFITGVTIVATCDTESAPRGLTANSFTSVSLAPPLVSVCVARAAASCDAFSKSTVFSVNILREDQKHVSGLFASKRTDKFDQVEWRWGRAGCPVLRNALATIECETYDRILAGDHIILVGKVITFERFEAQPLVYYRGGYVSLGLSDHAIDKVDGHPAVIGCIATWEDRVLLCKPASALQWETPLSTTWPSRDEFQGRARLLKMIERFGTTLTLSFPYSVFENERDRCVYVIYRGTLSKPLARKSMDDVKCRLFKEDEMPWSSMRADLFHTMLRRFFRERARDQFGIFSDVGGFNIGMIVKADGTS